jgi:hypothetical protein
LQTANQTGDAIGYFPLSDEELAAQLTSWGEMTGLTTGTAATLFPASGDIRVTGSSTVAPLTEAVAEAMQATGRLNGTVAWTWWAPTPASASFASKAWRPGQRQPRHEQPGHLCLSRAGTHPRRLPGGQRRHPRCREQSERIS